jgi:hypothetical protein
MYEFSCVTNHYLVVSKLRERLAVSKKGSTEFNTRHNLRKSNELEVRKQYQIEITNRLAA